MTEEKEQRLVKAKKSMSWFDIEAIGIFGVVLPVITLTVEATTHLCGHCYVDPIPSWWHFLAIAFVAVANGIVWQRVMVNKVDAPWIPWVLGASIGVAIFYAAVFAPLSPISVMLIAGMGIGFLPLSPILAFLSAIRLAFIVKRNRKANSDNPPKMRGLWQGVAIGVVYLVIAEMPNAVTDAGLRQAISDDANTSRAGVRLIRTFGNEQSLLRSCYHHMASVSDIPTLAFSLLSTGSLDSSLRPALSVDQARQVYYRAYGRPFNTVPRPTFSAGLMFSENTDEPIFWDRDVELAGENVGGRTAGVRMAKSDIATTFDPDAATSYTEWTMAFSNEGKQDQEARMQIELPQGGVVSRATLWVNGEAREAAFGERNLVRRAYQSVVLSKRDPLLVTSVGPNKVMVQCFPVPAVKEGKPGEIKVRIGITAPCVVPELGQAQVTLPQIAERGFPVSCKHDVRIESAAPFTCSLEGLKDGSDATAKRIYGSIEDSVLRDEPIVAKASRNAAIRSFWSAAPMSAGRSFITEELKQSANKKPSKLFIVIDGSGAMAKYMPQVASALAKVPADMPTELTFASDEISSLVDKKQKADLSTSLRELMHAPCVGGPDNLAPLGKAWQQAGKEAGSAVMWIHGPQPVLFDSYEVENKLSDIKPRLYDVAVYPSPNRILEKAPPALQVQQIPRIGSLKTDLERFISRICGSPNGEYSVARNVTTKQPVGAGTVSPLISSQLTSLWAYNETLTLLQNDKPKDAVKLAARYRLVTPVTGAVVLETNADYKKQGIDQNNPDNNATDSAPPFQIGAAPEPEEYALMLVALMVVAWQIWRNKSFRRRTA